MTLLVSAISLVFGSLVGFLGAGAKLSRWRAPRFLADAYTTIIRGIPVQTLSPASVRRHRGGRSCSRPARLP
jgi:ABC-type arginine transport system permease subunit